MKGAGMREDLQSKLRQFDCDRSLDRAETIPSFWYSDQEIFELEQRSVFGDTWQVVGRADQVAEAGSFFTAGLASEPVLVVRDEGKVLRAFYNVCRHRAARVAIEPEGQVKKLRCRYHGWTYDLSGRLRGTPEFDGVANFRREDNGLAPITVAVWGPLVCVHLGPAVPSLEEFLAPLPQRTAGLGLERMRFVERRDYHLACNWKVFVDNFLDGGYHVNTIHPGLAGVLDYSQYRTEIAGQTSVQISPLKNRGQGSGVRGQERENMISEFVSTPDSMAKVRTGDAAYYWWLFPNFMMNIYEGVMDTNLVLPIDTDSCRVIMDFYFTQTEGAEARQFITQSIEAAQQIQHEDIGICEDVQKGLASRCYDTGRFSVRREAAGYHFHQLLARRLQQAGERACKRHGNTGSC
jgi:choline monooxygenase